MTIVLIGCGKTKLEHPAPAEQLYTGALFQKSVLWARQQWPEADFAVLSALYGFVPFGTVTKPYDRTLSRMTAREREAWLVLVERQIRDRYDTCQSRFIILAGERYYAVKPFMECVELPLQGLSMGRRLQFLKHKLEATGHQELI